MSNMNDETIYKCTLEQYKFMREKVNSTIHNNKDGNKVDEKLQKVIDNEVKKLLNEIDINFSGSIFIRQNSKNPRIFSAIITGPENTPYDSGCIPFEIYIPEKYPECPPKIKCTSYTGYSHFNNDIMHSGYVMMPLLNSFQTTVESEKWNPLESSIYQVLFSIQNVLLTENPYFNSKYRNNERNTEAGRKNAYKYNHKVKIITTASCIYDMLKNPPPEFKNVIRTHFLIKRDYIKSLFFKWKTEYDPSVADDSFQREQFSKHNSKTLHEWVALAESLLDELDMDTNKKTQNNNTFKQPTTVHPLANNDKNDDDDKIPLIAEDHVKSDQVQYEYDAMYGGYYAI